MLQMALVAERAGNILRGILMACVAPVVGTIQTAGVAPQAGAMTEVKTLIAQKISSRKVSWWGGR